MAKATWLKVNGEWKKVKPWINVGGTWKPAKPKGRIGGTWRSLYNGNAETIFIGGYAGNLSRHKTNDTPSTSKVWWVKLLNILSYIRFAAVRVNPLTKVLYAATESSTHAVYKFDYNGNQLKEVKGPEVIYDMAVDRNGFVYLATSNGIKKLTPDLDVVAIFGAGKRYSVVASDDGKYIYAIGASIHKLDAKDGSVVWSTSANNTQQVAYDPVSKYVYATNPVRSGTSTSDPMAIYKDNGTTNTVIASTFDNIASVGKASPVRGQYIVVVEEDEITKRQINGKTISTVKIPFGQSFDNVVNYDGSVFVTHGATTSTQLVKLDSNFNLIYDYPTYGSEYYYVCLELDIGVYGAFPENFI